jgi:hypothetical protein
VTLEYLTRNCQFDSSQVRRNVIAPAAAVVRPFLLQRYRGSPRAATDLADVLRPKSVPRNHFAASSAKRLTKSCTSCSIGPAVTQHEVKMRFSCWLSFEVCSKTAVKAGLARSPLGRPAGSRKMAGSAVLPQQTPVARRSRTAFVSVR